MLLAAFAPISAARDCLGLWKKLPFVLVQGAEFAIDLRTTRIV
jgi:hypothetical protein